MTTNNSINTGKPITVAQGGTGDSSLTAYAVLCGGTTSTGNVQSIAGVGTSGQVLTSNGAGALPTFQAISDAGTWVTTITTSQAMASNTSYVAASASLITFTLPSTAAVGDRFQIMGYLAGGWTIAQNLSQQIYFNNQATTSGTGGSISSVTQYDAIVFRCIVANTLFSVENAMGANFTVV